MSFDIAVLRSACNYKTGQGPKEKDSTAVGGTANAPGDRKGPIPSIIGGRREIDRVRFPPKILFKTKKAPTRGAFLFWSGRRESDPHGQLGKLKFYH